MLGAKPSLPSTGRVAACLFLLQAIMAGEAEAISAGTELQLYEITPESSFANGMDADEGDVVPEVDVGLLQYDKSKVIETFGKFFKQRDASNEAAKNLQKAVKDGFVDLTAKAMAKITGVQEELNKKHADVLKQVAAVNTTFQILLTFQKKQKALMKSHAGRMRVIRNLIGNSPKTIELYSDKLGASGGEPMDEARHIMDEARRINLLGGQTPTKDLGLAKVPDERMLQSSAKAAEEATGNPEKERLKLDVERLKLDGEQKGTVPEKDGGDGVKASTKSSKLLQTGSNSASNQAGSSNVASTKKMTTALEILKSTINEQVERLKAFFKGSAWRAWGTELERKAEDLKDKLQSAEGDITQLKEIVDEAAENAAKHDELKNSKEETEKRAASLKKELADAQGRLAKKNAETQALVFELTALKQNSSKSEAARQSMEEELRSTKTNFKKQLKKTLGEMKKLRSDLRLSLEEKKFSETLLEKTIKDDDIKLATAKQEAKGRIGKVTDECNAKITNMTESFKASLHAMSSISCGTGTAGKTEGKTGVRLNAAESVLRSISGSSGEIELVSEPDTLRRWARNDDELRNTVQHLQAPDEELPSTGVQKNQMRKKTLKQAHQHISDRSQAQLPKEPPEMEAVNLIKEPGMVETEDSKQYMSPQLSAAMEAARNTVDNPAGGAGTGVSVMRSLSQVEDDTMDEKTGAHDYSAGVTKLAL